MKREDMQQQVITMKSQTSYLERLLTSAGCKDCKHSRTTGNQVWCQKFDQYVPAEFDGVDCEEWRWDQIPF